ncbi:MAG: 50S ribosomal protein L19 [Bacteriovoracaceae bacterium]
MNLVDLVNKNHMKKSASDLPDFKAGDTISVSVRISEGGKTRIQLFDGTCIAIKGNKNNTDGHFRVRKTSSGTGVERVFPYHSPNVEGVKVLKRGKVRRAKHFYLRDRTGKAARIETDYSQKAQAKKDV